MDPILGVNIDHVATLRQVRGTSYPNLLKAAQTVLSGGASQITVHLREDRRHIQKEDVFKLARFLKETSNRKKKTTFNLEMALTKSIVDIAVKVQPDWVCLVPEKRKELTTEGGLALKKIRRKLNYFLPFFHKKNIQVSLFVEPELSAVREASALGVQAVELHSGAYALASSSGEKKKHLKKLKDAALLAWDLGIRAHIGHGLLLENLRALARFQKKDHTPLFIEYNIGHAIVCEALLDGLERVTRRYVSVIQAL